MCSSRSMKYCGKKDRSSIFTEGSQVQEKIAESECGVTSRRTLKTGK